jgi:hypothetical protein
MGERMKQRLVRILFTLGLLASPALLQQVAAQQETSPASSSGVRFSIGGNLQAEFGSTRQGQLWPTNAAFTVKFEGSVGDPDFPTATFLINLRSSLDASGRTRVDLREAQVNASIGRFDLIVGNQIIAWGVGDVFNPANIINPLDLVNPLEQVRQPVLGLRSTYNISDATKLEVVFVPGFQTNTLPNGLEPPPPPNIPGLTIVGIDPLQDNRPEFILKNVQGGARFGTRFNFLEGADLNLSYWNGWRATPTATANITPVTPDQVRLQPVLNYDRIQVIGGDLTVAYQGFIAKLETAYTITQDMKGQNPAIGGPSLEIVGQAEYSPDPSINTIFSVDFLWTRGEGVGNDTYTVQTAFVGRFDLDNRTTFEGAWVQNYMDRSGLITAKLSHTLADGLSLYATGGFFYGSSASSYGSLSKASQLRFGLKFSF